MEVDLENKLAEIRPQEHLATLSRKPLFYLHREYLAQQVGSVVLEQIN